MELKQLEYFTVVCKKGSFSKAAECLYTTQPNVSKVVGALERELGHALIERTSRGIQITPYGNTVLEYAGDILRRASMITSMADHNHGKKFAVATYPSNMIARLLSDFYLHWKDKYVVEHQEGNVEDVCNLVARGQCEIGIVYIAKCQLPAFNHILEHKKLAFEAMGEKEACIYVGPENPLYEKDCIDFLELSSLKFVKGIRDYFSVEHHLEKISLGTIGNKNLKYVMCSDSDHVITNALLHTDLCSLGIEFIHDNYQYYNVKNLKINDCEPFLTIGYVYLEKRKLSSAAKWFLRKLKEIL